MNNSVFSITILCLAVGLRIVSNCMSNVYQKKLTSKAIDPLFINALTYTMLSVLSLPFVFVTGLFEAEKGFWLYSVLVGIFGALGNGFLIKALKNGDLSILGPINAYKPIVSIIFAVILLKEIPNLLGILGILLVVAGSYFVLNTTEEKFSFALLKNKEIRYRFLSLFFCGTEAVFIKKTILLSSVENAFIAWCFFGALFSLLLLGFARIDLKEQIPVFEKKNLFFVAGIILCVGVMQFTTNFVFRLIDVAYALSLFQLGAILSVVLGWKYFKEKHILVRLAGSFVMVAGAVVIILYN